MTTLVIVIHIAVSLFLIGAVLLQAGKGASIGATFGGGNQTLFGTSGGSLLGKITSAAAVIFMLTSLTLAYFSSSASTSSIMRDVAVPVQTTAPVESPPAEAQPAK